MPCSVDDRGKAMIAGFQSTVVQISLSSIIFRSHSVRKYFDREKIATLSNSLGTHGQIQPIIVRALPKQDIYEIISGESRYIAAQNQGMRALDAIVIECDDTQSIKICLLDNMIRDTLSCVEETETILTLIEIYLSKSRDEAISLLYRIDNHARGKTSAAAIAQSDVQAVKDLFTELHYISWQTFVKKRLPILKFPPDVLMALASNTISVSTARMLSQTDSPQIRQHLLENPKLLKTHVHHKKLQNQQGLRSMALTAKQLIDQIERCVTSPDERHQQRALLLLRELKNLFDVQINDEPRPKNSYVKSIAHN
jgi:ParB family transcriptional regulator, chromosome partitioning protein